jgi:hypothetical protein
MGEIANELTATKVYEDDAVVTTGYDPILKENVEQILTKTKFEEVVKMEYNEVTGKILVYTDKDYPELTEVVEKK